MAGVGGGGGGRGGEGQCWAGHAGGRESTGARGRVSARVKSRSESEAGSESEEEEESEGHFSRRRTGWLPVVAGPPDPTGWRDIHSIAVRWQPGGGAHRRRGLDRPADRQGV